MALELQNRNGLNRYIAEQAKRIDMIMIRRMEVMVQELTNHAKSQAGYEDQTSNLKGSIGGMVLKDGQIIDTKGFDYSADENGKGAGTGVNFINELAKNYTKGYVILMVAGMEYASYVENEKNKNVLAATEMKMERDLPKLFEYIERKINQK